VGGNQKGDLREKKARTSMNPAPAQLSIIDEKLASGGDGTRCHLDANETDRNLNEGANRKLKKLRRIRGGKEEEGVSRTQDGESRSRFRKTPCPKRTPDSARESIVVGIRRMDFHLNVTGPHIQVRERQPSSMGGRKEYLKSRSHLMRDGISRGVHGRRDSTPPFKKSVIRRKSWGERRRGENPGREKNFYMRKTGASPNVLLWFPSNRYSLYSSRPTQRSPKTRRVGGGGRKREPLRKPITRQI